MGKLGERARHVVGGGYDHERMKTALDRPAPRLHGIAERVDGGIIEIDATVEELVVTRCLVGDIGDGRAGIDPADQEPFAAAGRKQLQGVLESARAVPRDDSIHPHDPPPADTTKLLARLEKKAGALPLSLRAFYEVVGAVDFTGSHASLAPPRGSICPDPLVIFPLEDVLAYLEEMDGDDDDIRLMLAPDDIHKAGQSGGEPYEMATPDARADGELLNELHELFFVDYLRLAFRFGGFPGYDGHDPLPPEIETLRGGLLEF